MSSTDAEIMSTESSAQAVLMKTSEDTKSADGGTVIQPTGDAPPTTNGESTGKSDEKNGVSAPIEVSMEEEPKEDFDSVPAEIRHEETTSEVASDVKEGTSEPVAAEKNEVKVTEVEISKEEPVSKPFEKSEHGGWKLLSDQKKEEEQSVEPVVEKEAERMEVSASDDGETKELKVANAEEANSIATSELTEEVKSAEKPEKLETEACNVGESTEVTNPVEEETIKQSDDSKSTVEELPKEMVVSSEKGVVAEQVQESNSSGADQEAKNLSNTGKTKNDDLQNIEDQEGAEEKLSGNKTQEEEKMEVDEVKVDDVKEGCKADEEGETNKIEEAESIKKTDGTVEEVEHVPEGENTSSSEKEEQVEKDKESEKMEIDNEKVVEEDDKTTESSEKVADDSDKMIGEIEKPEEVKSPSAGVRGRGRGRGRGSRSSTRSSAGKQLEVPAEGIANTRPRRSTRSTVDYANPDVATVVAEQEDLENELQQKVTRGRGRGRGRGGHRAGKRSADDDEDAEDSGSEYGGPSKRKKARGSSSSGRGRGRGRGRGGRTRSARGKKKDKEENDSDDDEEEMDLGDDDAPSDGSAEETYKPSKRRSDANQSVKSSPKKRGRRTAGSKAADED